MRIAAYCERETARNRFLLAMWRRALQGTACEHRLLGTVERNGAKFLPIADELIFHYDFVDGELPLKKKKSRAMLVPGFPDRKNF